MSEGGWYNGWLLRLGRKSKKRSACLTRVCHGLLMGGRAEQVVPLGSAAIWAARLTLAAQPLPAKPCRQVLRQAERQGVSEHDWQTWARLGRCFAWYISRCCSLRDRRRRRQQVWRAAWATPACVSNVSRRRPWAHHRQTLQPRRRFPRRHPRRPLPASPRHRSPTQRAASF